MSEPKRRYFTTQEQKTALRAYAEREPGRYLEISCALVAQFGCNVSIAGAHRYYTEDEIIEAVLGEDFKVSATGRAHGLPDFLPKGSHVVIAKHPSKRPGEFAYASYSVSYNHIFAGTCEELIPLQKP